MQDGPSTPAPGPGLLTDQDRKAPECVWRLRLSLGWTGPGAGLSVVSLPHLSFSLLDVVGFVSGVRRLQTHGVLLELPHLRTRGRGHGQRDQLETPGGSYTSEIKD